MKILKNRKRLIILQFWRSEVLEPRCRQGSFLSEGSVEGSSSWSFPVSRGCLHSWAHGSFLQLQIQWCSIFRSLSLPLLLSPHLLPLPLYKDPCGYTGPTQTVQGHLPNSRSFISSHLQSKLTGPQFPGITTSWKGRALL